ncbi:hypothetical protein RND81_05G120700 [Saponaria officinalis]|uniref:SWIM-type domain-containing protein n=1 Tax=Saponaria officinalis TaxID=3572 RepID=A0AAW1L023_SAPOF
MVRNFDLNVADMQIEENDCGTKEVSCTCMKFERCGLICRHIISILSSNGVNSILDGYVIRRWCKELAHHDKRNCPNPYADRPPPTPESSSDEDDIDEEVEEYVSSD